MVAALCCALGLSGCAPLLERAALRTRFEAAHGCDAERVVPTAGGYYVVGCGLRAHYTCAQLTYDEYDYDHDESFGENLLGLLINAAFEAAFDPEECFEARVDGTRNVPERPWAPMREYTDGQGRDRLETAVSIGGGARLVGLPERAEPSIGLHLTLPEAPAGQDCEAEVRLRARAAGPPVGVGARGYHAPGTRRRPIEQVHVSGRSVWLAFTTGALEELAAGSQVELSVCGRRTEVGPSARQRIRDFLLRYRRLRGL